MSESIKEYNHEVFFPRGQSGETLFRRTSYVSGITREKIFPITREQWLSYVEGSRTIQDAFPHLTDSDREFLITGIIDSEWDDVMGEEK